MIVGSAIMIKFNYGYYCFGGGCLRPIVWGLILTVIGAFFWILFSVVFGVVYGLAGGEMPAIYWALIYISGFAMYFSLPIAAIVEIYRYLKRRRAKKV
jgi:hypothetical protein